MAFRVVWGCEAGCGPILPFSECLGIFERDGRAWLLGSREHSGVPERVGLCMLEVEECRPLFPLRDTVFSVDRTWWDLCFRVCLQKGLAGLAGLAVANFPMN